MYCAKKNLSEDHINRIAELIDMVKREEEEEKNNKQLNNKKNVKRRNKNKN